MNHIIIVYTYRRTKVKETGKDGNVGREAKRVHTNHIILSSNISPYAIVTDKKRGSCTCIIEYRALLNFSQRMPGARKFVGIPSILIVSAETRNSYVPVNISSSRGRAAKPPPPRPFPHLFASFRMSI